MGPRFLAIQIVHYIVHYTALHSALHQNVGPRFLMLGFPISPRLTVFIVAPGSSPRTSRCHLLVEQEEDERSVAHLRECPIDAIKADTDESVEDKEKWLLLNKKFSAIWPNISKKKEPMEEHEKFRNIKDKYKKHFSEKPGK